jgi:hypothetical protein
VTIAVATAGAGFLLAVLWFDLMFDVQVRGRQEPSAEALASIASYYRRVTLQATPMNRLVALVMAGTIAALAVQIADGDAERWASVTSLVLVVAAAGLALSHTFANGARLGSGKYPVERQIALARLMLRDHLLCLAAIVTVLVLQLGVA